MVAEQQQVLVRYLQMARDALLWKLDGLGEYDVRRPMTPTGTNLLGLVKHLASVEFGYFVLAFDRPMPVALPWHADGVDHNADMWATAGESRDDIVGLYHLAWQEAARTFDEHDLAAEAHVPWWPAERNPVTLGLLLVHVATETHRHVGHADILRETIDGAVGHRAAVGNLPGEGYDWPRHVARIDEAARSFEDPAAG